jgi:hypothetical protein
MALITRHVEELQHCVSENFGSHEQRTMISAA